LPLWNRNQGNIRYAKHAVESARSLEEQRMTEITNEVLSTRAKLEQVEKEYQRATVTLGPDMEELNKSVNENFQRRNLSLLEFVDFFESYNENILQFNRLKMSRLSTYEELNYVTGSELFKP
jgi:cobalt-zinc-cadmium efflux system outer membrane protein